MIKSIKSKRKRGRRAQTEGNLRAELTNLMGCLPKYPHAQNNSKNTRIINQNILVNFNTIVGPLLKSKMTNLYCSYRIE